MNVGLSGEDAVPVQRRPNTEGWALAGSLHQPVPVARELLPSRRGDKRPGAYGHEPASVGRRTSGESRIQGEATQSGEGAVGEPEPASEQRESPLVADDHNDSVAVTRSKR